MAMERVPRTVKVERAEAAEQVRRWLRNGGHPGATDELVAEMTGYPAWFVAEVRAGSPS